MGRGCASCGEARVEEGGVSSFQSFILGSEIRVDGLTTKNHNTNTFPCIPGHICMHVCVLGEWA